MLDVFAGTSTTAVVAEALDRRWLMCELDQAYCDVLLDRLDDLRRRQAKAPEPVDVPEGVRTVPLPFALPAPRVQGLPNVDSGVQPDEVSDGIDLQEVG